jgi:hypothetical protein
MLMKTFALASFVALASVLQVRRAVGDDERLIRGNRSNHYRHDEQGSTVPLDSTTTATETTNATTFTNLFLSIPLMSHAERFPNATILEHEHDRRRRRHLSTSSTTLHSQYTQMNPLYQGYGTHYVDLWVGTPIPQRQTLIVDTGSAVTAFPCQECVHDCGTGHHVDSYYQESDSRTFHVVECSRCKIGACHRHYGKQRPKACLVTANYQEGSSWKAFEASDVVYSGGPHDSILKTNRHSFRMHFCCQTKLTGFFQTQMADGIMGMEMASSSMWKQMYNQGVLQEKSFALCLSRQATVSRSGTLAGSMTLGGVNPKLHNTNMVYANQINTKGWFVVRLKRLFLRTHGGEFVQVPHADKVLVEYRQVDVLQHDDEDGNNDIIVLDSGTTDTYLSQTLYHDFNKAWKSLMDGRSYNNDNRRYTNDELALLPTILFQLEAHDKDDGDLHTPGLVGEDLDPNRPTDVLVAMPPTHYMEYNPNTKRYTSRLYFNEKKGGVLGANFMMGHDVYFDAHRGRIGFAESTCDYYNPNAGENEDT